MHVVIMGCGRVGSALSFRLLELGHSVAIIDKEENAFQILGDDFTGQKVLGIGFDRDTLIEAGIEKAQAFAAVSSGDNSNIVSARVARETFNVPLVVARIYDPRRAKVYERLGIPTVASVPATATNRRASSCCAGSSWASIAAAYALHRRRTQSSPSVFQKRAFGPTSKLFRR